MNIYSITISGNQKRELVLMVLVTLILVSTAVAQTTSRYERRGTPSTSTEIRSGEVVWISGREIMVKMDDGQTKHFTVPQGATFTVDGKKYGLSALKTGMRLTQVITTTSTPKTIVTVRQVSGKVWYVNAPKTVILTLPDGTNKQFTVPDKTKFEIGGVEKTVFDLKKGMEVTATAVTQVPEMEVSRQSDVTGQPAPVAQAAQPAAELPPADQVKTVLVDDSSQENIAAAGTAVGNKEPAPKRLPKTGTSVPLIGLLGGLLLLTAFGLRASRNVLRKNRSV